MIQGLQNHYVDIIKFLLGLFAFTIIGFCGVRDKRLAGVFLTFPILNSVALLTAVDPYRVAYTVYAVVVWNACVFALFVTLWRSLNIPKFLRWLVYVLCLCVLWSIAAYLLTEHRDELPGGAYFFVMTLGLSAFFIWLSWAPRSVTSIDPPPTFKQYVRSLFFTRAVWRVCAFAGVFVAILIVASTSLDAKWVGFASALPLPGICALASIASDQSHEDLKAIRDTVFLGPLLVIPFNWSLATILDKLGLLDAGHAWHLTAVAAAWLVAASMVLFLVPLIETYFDRLFSKPKTQL